MGRVRVAAALVRFRDEIAALLDARKWPMDWVDAQIEAGRIAVHENDTALIGVEVREYPGGLRELHGMFAAGEMAGILQLIDESVAAARLNGLDAATIASRPGWARALKGRGFNVDQVTITKDLRDGA